jgi:hypothetical protein
LVCGNADQPDGLTFTNARGDPITSAPNITKPTGPPPAPAKRYIHPLGERLDRWAVMFHDPPPADDREPALLG